MQTMKKNFIIIPLLLFSCSKSVSNNEIARVNQKDRTIDSLKAELTDCKGQAEIMADILEKERIELLNNLSSG